MAPKENSVNPPREILVAEDSPTQAEQLRFLLEDKGYRVTLAPNGKAALAAARARQPALVISDILMPEMNGFELCQAMKQDAALGDIPVVLLTTLSDPEEIVQGLKAGADYYLTKPFNADYLLSMVHILLHRPVRRLDPHESTAVEVTIGGERQTINTHHQQIINLLFATYENTVRQNHELVRMQRQLEALNEQLEARVAERTEALHVKNEETVALSQQLLQAGKLATMGELAASIAHEINNPLATITLRVESLLLDLAEGDPRRRELGIIRGEVERIAKLVLNLLNFSRRRGQEVTTLDLRQVITDTLELVSYHFRRHRIQVVREEMPNLPLLLADRQQMQQLFLNLFTNANDAMPQGGTLSIRVRPEDEASTGAVPAQTDPPPTPPPAKVLIEIADTGPGISPENLEKVMEPFFTTKPEGKGTGLGLPICRRIVQGHDGTLQISSELGKGTTVRILLPVNARGKTNALM